MPYCIRCETEKPSEKFPAYNLKTGNTSWCRECRRAYDREYQRRKPAKRKAREARYRANNPEAVASRKQRYRDLHRERKRASDCVRHALDSGRISRPDSCEMCGVAGDVVAHHDSYAVEDRLRVVWLCRRCHSYTHRMRGDYEASKTA